MNKKNRQKLATIMKSAWKLARFGANNFGGKVADYFRMALIITWYDENHPSVQIGRVIHFLLPGLNNTSHACTQGQLLLPGMSL